MTLRNAYLVIAVLMGCLVAACEKPQEQARGRGWKEEWHPACKVASAFAPMNFKERIKYSKQWNVKQYDQIGECRAEKIRHEIWFVRGVWLNNAMRLDGIPAINYEAVMYEENDPNEIAVKRYGTQFGICSIAIEGEDRTGNVRYNRCGDGKFILEFKKLHHL